MTATGRQFFKLPARRCHAALSTNFLQVVETRIPYLFLMYINVHLLTASFYLLVESYPQVIHLCKTKLVDNPLFPFGSFLL